MGFSINCNKNKYYALHRRQTNKCSHIRLTFHGHPTHLRNPPPLKHPTPPFCHINMVAFSDKMISFVFVASPANSISLCECMYFNVFVIFQLYFFMLRLEVLCFWTLHWKWYSFESSFMGKLEKFNSKSAEKYLKIENN